ncbi:MAG: 50S ribosomal protein L18 [Nitrospinota bacterium]|nr:50S ribosomal protein L18 [Nitrospinota bacterium]MDH5678066.1 50S ribosomal protein L18 [Nitrospinota bacterium]MDH5755546.1 50S ribosomal protein L18 [Nitrospinota bacterium]
MKRVLDSKRRLMARKARIRKKIRGTSERPRVSVCFSNKNIIAQVIDDDAGRTLVSLSSLGKDSPAKGKNAVAARQIGEALADKMKASGISTVVFDRNGKLYHGRVKVFAEAMREKGLIL